MRRQDKEVDGILSLHQIIKAQRFIRLGFFNQGEPAIRPVIVKDLSSPTITVEDICHRGKVSFQAHIYNGIKTADKICSYSSRYLSVYGMAVMENNCLNIDFITGKQSNFAQQTILPTSTQRQFIQHSPNINLSETMQLGIPCSHELYIVPVQQVKIGDSLYFHSAKSGRKHSLLSENPNIIIQWEAPAHNDGKIFYTNCHAQAVKVSDDNEKCNAMQAIVFETSGVNAPFTPNQLKNTEIFKINTLPYYRSNKAEEATYDL